MSRRHESQRYNTDTARDAMLERPLPNSAEAERAILGAILLDNGLIEQAMMLLVPDDFYVPSHRRIFVAMTTLAARGSEINAILLAEVLRVAGEIESVGGVVYITNLMLGLPHFSDVVQFARVVKGKALLRNIVRACNRVVSAALEEEDEPQAILTEAERVVFELGADTRGDKVRRFDVIGRAVREEVELWRQGRVTSVPTGVPELDDKLKLRGLARKDLIYIAARSSRGKTALLLQIAKNAALAGTGVLLFSLEMSGESLYFRNLSSIAGVEHWKLRPDSIHDGIIMSKLETAYPTLDALPIYVVEGVRRISQIEAISRHYVRRFKVGLIGGDYIQLGDAELKNRTRNEEVGHLSGAGKSIASALDVPFVWTSQLKRGKSDGERPELDDMRESGNQEQDADVVMMPYSSNKQVEETVRAMKLYVPKQRNGRAGFELEVEFDADFQTFLTDRMYAEREVNRIERGDDAEPFHAQPFASDDDDFAVTQ
jgi:replicative DNA helicase